MEKQTTLGDVIRKIARDQGEKSLLDSRSTQAMFMDLAPTLKKEKELLRSFYLCNGAEKLIRDLAEYPSGLEGCMNSLVRDLEEKQGMSHNAACFVCSEFYYGLTGRRWAFVQPVPKNLDVHKQVTIQNSERNTGKKLTVDVDGSSVNITLPVNIEDGKTLCFKGKGKRDYASGKSGDLYVTIYVTPAKQKNPAAIGLAVAAAVIVIFFALFLRKEPGGNTQLSQNDSGGNTQILQNDSGGHTHSWMEATCTSARYCTTCNATEGSALGHIWQEATVSAPKTCSRCGATDGEALKMEPKSLSEFSITGTRGKVWLRSNGGFSGSYHSAADAPACWSDWSKWGYSSGAVKDNKGNQYDFGIHVDGDQRDSYYFEIQLNGQYTTFSGTCGCPEKGAAISSYVYNTSTSYTKYFEVYGDGKLLYTSATMRYDYSPQDFSIDVTGVQVLRIQYPATVGPNEIATLFGGMLS